MTQKEALDILKTGRNVFLTGAAGSGKTFVLRQYINHLKELGAIVGITASTGIAATHMGGITIHSWSGLGIREHLDKDEISQIAEKQYIQKKIKEASVLILDEVSMLHHFSLDLIEKIVKKVKDSEAPFGGMQVVFCGDFFQLPPVRKVGTESFFAYQSEAWKNLELKICYLSEQHRQNDDTYLDILNAIRNSTVNSETRAILESRIDQKYELEPTKLYPHNIDVDIENETELQKIPGMIFEYKMQERGKKNLIENLKKGCLAPEILRLKEGARVMFVKNNFDEGYVNGTLGSVEKCDFEKIEVKTNDGRKIEVKRESWIIEDENRVLAQIIQFPLRLAWAITIHKSQGMSLDSALIDLSRSFESGMGYVALSRVRSLNGLFLKGFNETALSVNPKVLAQDQIFKKLSEATSFHIRTMGEKKIWEMHQSFEEKIKNKKSKEKKLDTVNETKILLDQGLQLKKIAKKRGLKISTILDHIEEIKESNPEYKFWNLRQSIPQTKFKTIYNAFKKGGIDQNGKYRLAPVKNLLGTKYSYEDLRLVRLFLN